MDKITDLLDEIDIQLTYKNDNIPDWLARLLEDFDVPKIRWSYISAELSKSGRSSICHIKIKAGPEGKGYNLP